MADKKKERISLTKYDPFESPEEIIAADKDEKRKKAFEEVFKRIDLFAIRLGLLPNKKKSTSGGGTSFTQSIVVTPDKVTLETKEAIKKEEKLEERERED